MDRLADEIQLHGVEMDRMTIWRIESHRRGVSDIEALAFARALKVDMNKLFLR
jgi:hypothetical protein